jgi:hypothetical protein
MQYKIWSTYPPSLTQDLRGYKTVHAGTITAIQVGRVTLPNDTKFPASTTLDQFVWQRPTPKVFQPTIKHVAGSKGKTYIVKSTANGKWECSCPGYSFRRTCKHIGA